MSNIHEPPSLLTIGKITLTCSVAETWLPVAPGWASSKSGRFAAVTTVEPVPDPVPHRSRGELTADFLIGTQDTEGYLQGIQDKAGEYRGFNLLLCDGEAVWYYSNQNSSYKQLPAGYYGLSNQLTVIGPRSLKADKNYNLAGKVMPTASPTDCLTCCAMRETAGPIRRNSF